MPAEAVVEGQRGLGFGTMVLSAIALYAVADLTELWSGAISGDQMNTLIESHNAHDVEEALRTKHMVFEHVFGGSTGAPPDPEDDGGFERIFARVILYAGVAAELARRLKISPSNISRWANGGSRPRPYARPTVIQRLKETLDDMFGPKE